MTNVKFNELLVLEKFTKSKCVANSSGIWYEIIPFLPSSASVAIVCTTADPISRLSFTATRYSLSPNTGGLSLISRTWTLRVRYPLSPVPEVAEILSLYESLFSRSSFSRVSRCKYEISDPSADLVSWMRNGEFGSSRISYETIWPGASIVAGSRSRLVPMTASSENEIVAVAGVKDGT